MLHEPIANFARPSVLTIAAPPAGSDENRLLLGAYSEWLRMERRLLHMELFPDAHPRTRDYLVPEGVDVARAFHLPAHPERWQDRPQPSTRADLVLRAVGCFSGAVAPEGFERVERDGQTWFRQGPVDPIYAAINRHVEARTACILVENGDDDDRAEDACRAEVAALNALAGTRPTTNEGLIAVGVHLARSARLEKKRFDLEDAGHLEVTAMVSVFEAWAGDTLPEAVPALLHAAE